MHTSRLSLALSTTVLALAVMLAAPSMTTTGLVSAQAMNAPAVGYGYIPPPPTSGVAAYEEDCDDDVLDEPCDDQLDDCEEEEECDDEVDEDCDDEIDDDCEEEEDEDCDETIVPATGAGVVPGSVGFASGNNAGDNAATANANIDAQVQQPSTTANEPAAQEVKTPSSSATSLSSSTTIATLFIGLVVAALSL